MSRWKNYDLEQSIKKVFGNTAGEELLDFMVDAWVMRRSWQKGEADATAFFEGEKNLVLTLRNLYLKGAGE